MMVTDLLCDADTLAKRLRDALRDEQWLDGYLFAAGLGQLADDRLHSDPFLFNRAAVICAASRRGRPGSPWPLLADWA